VSFSLPRQGRSRAGPHVPDPAYRSRDGRRARDLTGYCSTRPWSPLDGGNPGLLATGARHECCHGCWERRQWTTRKLGWPRWSSSWHCRLVCGLSSLVSAQSWLRIMVPHN